MLITVLATGLLLLPVALAVLDGRGRRPAHRAPRPVFRIRGIGWVVAALGTQVLILAVPELLDRRPHWLPAGLHVLSYALAAGFVLANPALPGLRLVGLGTLLNGLTIAVNGGTLPTRPAALQLAGLDGPAPAFANSAVLEHPRLWFLGDVFAVPEAVPLANVFSVGDLVLLAGVAAVGIRASLSVPLDPQEVRGLPIDPRSVAGFRHHEPDH